MAQRTMRFYKPIDVREKFFLEKTEGGGRHALALRFPGVMPVGIPFPDLPLTVLQEGFAFVLSGLLLGMFPGFRLRVKNAPLCGAFPLRFPLSIGAGGSPAILVVWHNIFSLHLDEFMNPVLWPT